jgi:hypothetical protein
MHGPRIKLIYIYVGLFAYPKIDFPRPPTYVSS